VESVLDLLQPGLDDADQAGLADGGEAGPRTGDTRLLAPDGASAHGTALTRGFRDLLPTRDPVHNQSLCALFVRLWFGLPGCLAVALIGNSAGWDGRRS
jgi:hypothetical protein